MFNQVFTDVDLERFFSVPNPKKQDFEAKVRVKCSFAEWTPYPLV
jgi:hypothetical protein